MRALSRRLTLVFLCAGLPGCVGGPRPDLTRGLVGHWKFDGDVSDSSGKGNDGVATGAPGFVEGKIGSSLKLDGQTQCVEVPALATSVTQLSIAAWIFVESMPSPGKLASIYHNNGWVTGDVHLPYFGPKGILDLGIRDNTPPKFIPAFRVRDLQKRWAHVAVTYDARDTQKVWFYLDGQPAGPFEIEDSNLLKLGPGQIGAWDREKQRRWFHGRIDEVYIFSRSLGAREVAALFALGNSNRVKRRQGKRGY